MTTTVDELDRGLGAGRRPGCCATFNEAGVLDAADVHVARGCAPARRDDESVALAVALAVRAVRGGSVCVDLAEVRDEVGDDGAELPWPELDDWLAALRRQPAARPLRTPLRLQDDRAALPRPLLARGGAGLRRPARRPAQPAPPIADEACAGAGARPGLPRRGVRRAAGRRRVAATQWTTVLTGGPGTGKTTTVAALLALLRRAGRDRRRRRCGSRWPRRPARPRPGSSRRSSEEVASGSPTADRDRLAGLRARDPAPAARRPPRHVGPVPPPPRQPAAARRGRGRRDLDGVADDDGAAARGGAPGDPADPGRRPRPARLGRGRRGAGRPGRRAGRGRPRRGGRAAHLAPVRRGDRRPRRGGARRRRRRRGRRCCEAGGEHVEFVEDDDPRAPCGRRCCPHALGDPAAAEAGDADAALEALDRQRLLCAHREGPYGVEHWNAQVERWLGEETGEPIWRLVRRPPAAGHRQRLRPRHLQRRHRRRRVRRGTGRRAAGRRRRQRRPARPRHQPARPGRDACTR